jgi:NADH dehydrogenase [ubiquinone] 1 alpha subcomplex assembly factor 5
MNDALSPPRDLFDRRRRAMRRDRCHGDSADYLGTVMAEQLVERLDDVCRPFGEALVIGGRNSAVIAALRQRGLAVTIVEPAPGVARSTAAKLEDEDRVSVDPESFDLVLWPGGLESVNDVPGALLRARMALRPDGLLLGCFVGDGSLPQLRAAFAAADHDRPAARLHPQISLAATGDLLQKIGLALPVVDVERLDLAYRNLAALVADLRAAALTNMLAGPLPRLSRAAWQAAQSAFAHAARDDSRTRETIRIVHFSGWAPHPDQPKAAKRGSATASLADALTSRPSG